MKSKEEILKLEHQVCFPIYTLSKEIVSMYRPYLDELDISYPQYLVLMVLWEEQQATVSMICEKLYLDTGTITPMLKRMEAKELIARTRQKNDERVVQITLTQKGKDLKKKAINIPYKLLEDIDLTQEELVFLRSITTKILKKSNK
ncbi:MAG: MarR family transcriptional regulator [Bacteroidetes bacterium 43-16]|nr:MAG: MarR family transcriptional regulator [Bacteroidetes bacterium 43-16]